MSIFGVRAFATWLLARFRGAPRWIPPEFTPWDAEKDVDEGLAADKEFFGLECRKTDEELCASKSKARRGRFEAGS